MSETIYYSNKSLVAGSIASQGTLQYGSASAMQGGSAVLAQTLQAGSIASSGTLQYGPGAAMTGGSAVFTQYVQAGSIGVQGALQYGTTSAMQGGSAVLAQTLQAGGVAVQSTTQAAIQATGTQQGQMSLISGAGSSASTISAIAGQTTSQLQMQSQTGAGNFTLRAQQGATTLQVQSQGSAAGQGQAQAGIVSGSAQAVVQVQGGQGIQMVHLGGSGSTSSQVVYRLGTVQSQQSSTTYSSFYVSGQGSAPPSVSTNPAYTIAGQNTGGFLWALGAVGGTGSSLSGANSAAGSQSALGCYIMIATGFNYISDMRLKKDVKQLTGHGLSSVAKLQGFLYEPSELAREMHPDNPIDVKAGLSAQEVYKVAPEIVNTGGFPVDEETGETPEPTMSVDYSRLVPYLVEAVKELKTRVEALEALTGNSGTA